MATETLRQRGSQAVSKSDPDLGASVAGNDKHSNASDEVKAAPLVQVIRIILFAAWFLGCCVVVNLTQFIGSPLYFYNRDYFYAYMAYTKQSFAVVVNCLTQWFSPTRVRVSWDADLKGQFKRKPSGRLESHLPERMIMISNHQIYTDWMYLWWLAYTSKMHGHVFIILKETLKWIPFMGTGMMFFGFVFMARKWASDQARLAHRLKKLKTRHAGPMAGSPNHLDPMWLMIFPEGTNLSANTRKRSVAWAKKQDIPDLKYQLLPRSTGLFFCLNELGSTVKYVYDCTMAYEGTPVDGYAQDYFTLRSAWIQGRPPKSVNMYWRRFVVADMPLDDSKAFDAWLNARWREKDEMLARFYETGRLPAGTEGIESKMSNDGYIDTEVCLESWWEIPQIFAVLAASALVVNVLSKIYKMFLS